MEEQEKANRNKQEQLEKNWNEREMELKKRETEYAELKAKVESMPEVIKKAENAAAIIAGNSIKKEYETKATLAQKDLEMFQKLAAQETASLKQAMEKATVEIASLKTQLDQDPRRCQGDQRQGAGKRQRTRCDGRHAEDAGEGTGVQAGQVMKQRAGSGSDGLLPSLPLPARSFGQVELAACFNRSQSDSTPSCAAHCSR